MFGVIVLEMFILYALYIALWLIWLCVCALYNQFLIFLARHFCFVNVITCVGENQVVTNNTNILDFMDDIKYFKNNAHYANNVWYQEIDDGQLCFGNGHYFARSSEYVFSTIYHSFNRMPEQLSFSALYDIWQRKGSHVFYDSTFVKYLHRSEIKKKEKEREKSVKPKKTKSKVCHFTLQYLVTAEKYNSADLFDANPLPRKPFKFDETTLVKIYYAFNYLDSLEQDELILDCYLGRASRFWKKQKLGKRFDSLLQETFDEMSSEQNRLLLMLYKGYICIDRQGRSGCVFYSDPSSYTFSKTEMEKCLNKTSICLVAAIVQSIGANAYHPFSKDPIYANSVPFRYRLEWDNASKETKLYSSHYIT